MYLCTHDVICYLVAQKGITTACQSLRATKNTHTSMQVHTQVIIKIVTLKTSQVLASSRHVAPGPSINRIRAHTHSIKSSLMKGGAKYGDNSSLPLDDHTRHHHSEENHDNTISYLPSWKCINFPLGTGNSTRCHRYLGGRFHGKLPCLLRL